VTRVFRKIGWAALAAVVLAAVAMSVLYERADTEFLALNDETRRDLPGDFIRLSDGLTHFEIAGPDDGDVVILVHGFSVPYYIWDTTFAALADAGFRVLRYDIYGRGYSDRPDTDYDSALFLRQIDELIDRLQLDTPVNLVGLSMGGAVVMHYASAHPARVRQIVVLDPAHEAGDAPPVPEAIGSYVLAISMIPELADGQLTDFLYPENYPDWVERYRVQMQYRGFRRAIISTLYHFATEDHLAAFGKVQDLGIPVQLIWGVEDQTVSIAGAEKVRRVLDVDFVPVEDAGHLPHIEKAGLVNPAIVRFLSSTR